MYIIAAFRSRNSAMKLHELLKSDGIRSEIVNTPREAYAGCGLCVKFEERNLGRVRNIVTRNNLTSFAGYFSIGGDGQSRQVTKIL